MAKDRILSHVLPLACTSLLVATAIIAPVQADDGSDACDTAPLDADTDEDGISDGAEEFGLSPLDGISTDPLYWDTDLDYLTDGSEVGLTAPIPGGESDGGTRFEGTETSSLGWQLDQEPVPCTHPLFEYTDGEGIIVRDEVLDSSGRAENTIGDSMTTLTPTDSPSPTRLAAEPIPPKRSRVPAGVAVGLASG